MSFSVPTKNRFAQLDPDAVFEAPTSKKSPATPESTISANGAKKDRPARGNAPRSAEQDFRPERRPFDREGAPRGRGGYRGGRGGFRGEQRSPVANVEGEDIVNVEDRGDRAIRRPRYERGGRGGSAFRGREFERRSGTGRGRELKKSGAGGHNWGTEGTENAEVVGENAVIELEQAITEENPIAAEGTETPEIKVESEEDNYVDFAEYQKAQKQKRAQLLQESAVAAPVREIDATELERDGYRRYEREETEEERVARELRMQQTKEDIESECDDDSRPKTYNLYDFTGDFGRRGGRGGRGRGGPRLERRAAPQPANLDLTDASAFPTLG